MRYFRYGHAKDLFVKVGDTIKKGQKIGTIGNGNGQYINASHLHFDIAKRNIQTWTKYVFGMSKNEVRNLYDDPGKYRKSVLPGFHHFGWEYLELATYGSKKCYHPGEDLNGKGAGDADYGLPFYSPVDGKVIYCYDGKDKNEGWGKLLVIRKDSYSGNTSQASKNTPQTNEKEKEVSRPISEIPEPITTEIPIDPSSASSAISLGETSGTSETSGKVLIEEKIVQKEDTLARIIKWLIAKWQSYRDTLLRR